MKINKLISGILVLAIMTVMISIAPPLFESIDNSADMTNSTYADQYNSTSDITRVTLSVFAFVPLLLVVGLVIMAVRMKK